jgi:hypothetical protein
MFDKSKDSAQLNVTSEQNAYVDPLTEIPKSKWERLWPVLACGSGLFSDGYINNVSRFLLIPHYLPG